MLTCNIATDVIIEVNSVTPHRHMVADVITDVFTDVGRLHDACRVPWEDTVTYCHLLPDLINLYADDI